MNAQKNMSPMLKLFLGDIIKNVFLALMVVTNYMRNITGYSKTQDERSHPSQNHICIYIWRVYNKHNTVLALNESANTGDSNETVTRRYVET